MRQVREYIKGRTEGKGMYLIFINSIFVQNCITFTQPIELQIAYDRFYNKNYVL